MNVDRLKMYVQCAKYDKIFPLNNQIVHFQYQCKVRILEIYKKPIQALVYQNDATGNLHAD